MFHLLCTSQYNGVYPYAIDYLKYKNVKLATFKGKQLKWRCQNDVKILRWSCGHYIADLKAD